MKIFLKRLNKSLHFEATNSKGVSMQLDSAAKDKDYTAVAVSPMEAVLSALAGCSSIDVVLILEKQRQPLDDIQVEVEAERHDRVPATFKKINLHYILIGDLDRKKAERAVKISMEKYCSVALMLNKACEITYSIELR